MKDEQNPDGYPAGRLANRECVLYYDPARKKKTIISYRNPLQIRPNRSKWLDIGLIDFI